MNWTTIKDWHAILVFSADAYQALDDLRACVGARVNGFIVMSRAALTP